MLEFLAFLMLSFPILYQFVSNHHTAISILPSDAHKYTTNNIKICQQWKFYFIKLENLFNRTENGQAVFQLAKQERGYYLARKRKML